MTSARRTTTHRRARGARKPVIAGPAATAALIGAWYATLRIGRLTP
ncbi:hypothetical protein ABT065_44160 [Streptomyces sp. NPDC002764]